MIRTTLTAALAACTIAIGLDTGHAADMRAPYPTYAPPPASPLPYTYSLHNWTGMYIGVSGGYHMGQERETFNDRYTNYARDLKINGMMIGATAGYNQQFGRFVLGFETDGHWMNTAGTSTETECVYQRHGACLMSFSTEDTTRINWMGTARLRAGVAFDRLLIFGTGGVGFGSMTNTHYEWFDKDRANATKISTDQFFGGWVVGGGAEYAITNNLTLKGQYLYGNFSTLSTTQTAGTYRADYHESLKNNHMATVGINYKF